jgi:hypothetical protein
MEIHQNVNPNKPTQGKNHFNVKPCFKVSRVLPCETPFTGSTNENISLKVMKTTVVGQEI